MTTTIQSAATTLRAPGVEFEVDEAQLAAVSFLARYSGRTLEADRQDLRGFFQWATNHGIVVLAARRTHIGEAIDEEFSVGPGSYETPFMRSESAIYELVAYDSDDIETDRMSDSDQGTCVE
jgi:hypothetical protein